MRALTQTIKFELDARLNEIATIEMDCYCFWGFTTTRGYNTWEGEPFKSFDEAYKALKKYEKNSISDYLLTAENL